MFAWLVAAVNRSTMSQLGKDLHMTGKSGGGLGLDQDAAEELRRRIEQEEEDGGEGEGGGANVQVSVLRASVRALLGAA